MAGQHDIERAFADLSDLADGADYDDSRRFVSIDWDDLADARPAIDILQAHGRTTQEYRDQLTVTVPDFSVRINVRAPGIMVAQVASVAILAHAGRARQSWMVVVERNRANDGMLIPEVTSRAGTLGGDAPLGTPLPVLPDQVTTLARLLLDQLRAQDRIIGEQVVKIAVREPEIVAGALVLERHAALPDIDPTLRSSWQRELAAVHAAIRRAERVRVRGRQPEVDPHGH